MKDCLPWTSYQDYPRTNLNYNLLFNRINTKLNSCYYHYSYPPTKFNEQYWIISRNNRTSSESISNCSTHTKKVIKMPSKWSKATSREHQLHHPKEVVSSNSTWITSIYYRLYPHVLCVLLLWILNKKQLNFVIVHNQILLRNFKRKTRKYKN